MQDLSPLDYHPRIPHVLGCTRKTDQRYDMMTCVVVTVLIVCLSSLLGYSAYCLPLLPTAFVMNSNLSSRQLVQKKTC